MKNIIEHSDGTFTFILHIKADERKELRKLSHSLQLNDFETIKYCLQLVSWWAKNKIEPED